MKWFVGKGATLGFAFALAALLVSGWLSFRIIQRISGNDALVIHTHEVLDEVRDILAVLRDAEVAQRSYLITADRTYLDPYQAGIAEVNGHVDRLQSLTTDNPVQQERITNLRPAVAARRDSLQIGIAALDAEGIEGARRYIA